MEIRGEPRIKISEEADKITFPGRKAVYRIYVSQFEYPVLDLLQLDDEHEPKVGEKLLVRDPFDEAGKAYVTPSRIVRLDNLVFEDGKIISCETLEAARLRCEDQVSGFNTVYLMSKDASTYKVYVSDVLYSLLHKLWMASAPVKCI